jgi:hypothetical protein
MIHANTDKALFLRLVLKAVFNPGVSPYVTTDKPMGG